uniref:hypothetical protein n=1 Tax=Acinetobacter baumannii TaxID=470 RepID=UPI001C07D647
GHTVTGTPVHLENKQVIREHEAAESVLDRSHHTMLTRFPVGGQRRYRALAYLAGYFSARAMANN